MGSLVRTAATDQSRPLPRLRLPPAAPPQTTHAGAPCNSRVSPISPHAHAHSPRIATVTHRFLSCEGGGRAGRVRGGRRAKKSDRVLQCCKATLWRRARRGRRRRAVRRSVWRRLTRSHFEECKGSSCARSAVFRSGARRRRGRRGSGRAGVVGWWRGRPPLTAGRPSDAEGRWRCGLVRRIPRTATVAIVPVVGQAGAFGLGGGGGAGRTGRRGGVSDTHQLGSSTKADRHRSVPRSGPSFSP